MCVSGKYNFFKTCPRKLACTLALTVCASCAISEEKQAPEMAAQQKERITLFSASNSIDEQWRHLPLRGKTEYRIDYLDGRIAIRARGKNSASGLIRRITIDTSHCRYIEWVWRVNELQESADLRLKDREDVAASIFLLFGDPGFLSNPMKVPTLRYVWTNDKIETETVVDNPYLPGVVRSLVVRSGEVNQDSWVHERRDLVRDFKRAFGRDPDAAIEAIALFTDNDQTQEKVEARYSEGTVTCDVK